MKIKYIKLFNKATHHLKYLINDIAKEREEHHIKVNILMKKHDKKINTMIKKGLNIVQEVLELYDELSKENGKKGDINVKIKKNNKDIILPKSKHELGYTKQEVLNIIKPYKIHYKTFWKKFGINTCAIHPETNETLYYNVDIITAIICCLENRDKYFHEWD